MRRAWAHKLLGIFGVWTGLALLAMVQTYSAHAEAGQPVLIARIVARTLTDYWLWAALTPAIFWLAARFPLHKGVLVRSTFAHVGFFLVFSVVHSVLFAVISGESIPVSAESAPGWWLARFYDKLWMYWPTLLVWTAFHYYDRYRERQIRAAQLQAELNEAQLAALRAQLQPHFLFNTLNAVSSLMLHDVRAADEMLADLADLLRASLETGASQEISLRQELDLIATYIRIQKARFVDRLRVEYFISPETLGASVPSFLLQPLVENAIRHGLGPRKKPGTVLVRSAQVGGSLVIEVNDDGVGLPANYREGIGISNTRARLRTLYEQAQSLELVGQDVGTLVRVTLPYQVASANGVLLSRHAHNSVYRR